jgi:hypothetical protein
MKMRWWRISRNTVFWAWSYTVIGYIGILKALRNLAVNTELELCLTPASLKLILTQALLFTERVLASSSMSAVETHFGKC